MDYELLTQLGLIGAAIGLFVSARMRYSRPIHLTDSRHRHQPRISSDGTAPDALRQDGRRIPSL